MIKMNPVGLNVNNVLEKKNKILEILKNKGPSLPSAISREIGVSLLFTSALLSEMINDKLVKCSHLKIGGSPLYYLSGQEIMLENFTKHLQAKEKEIFDLLKEKQVLNEELLEPAHRVAIKNIKDFAFSFKINEDKEKVFWRFHSLNQEDALEIAKKLSKQKEKITEAEKEIKGEERMKEKEKTEKRDVIEKEIGIRVRKKDKTELYNKVYEYLKNSGIETFEKINQDGIVCIALINFSFGIIKMLIVTSRKKKINEGDLSLAYQEGLSRKMPVLFLINGELTKKAKEYLNALGNYIFVKKM